MAVDITWLNDDHSAILYKLSGHWTWAEFSQQDRVGDEMMLSADRSVDVVVDFTGVTNYPPNAMSNFQYYVKQRSPNRQRIILVGEDAVFRAMAETFLKLAPRLSQEMHMVASLDQARNLVLQRD